MRLNQATLAQCNAQIKPNANSATAKVGIVHLGFGAFHRAHQALITDVVIKELGGDWKIVGVNWGGVDVKAQLEPQDCLYSVGIGHNDQLDIHVVGSVAKILNSDDIEAVQAYLHSPDVKLVSLTITEKGYCHNPATGDLNVDNPMIVHDLADIEHPTSAIGYLVSAIKYRKEHNIAPFTPLTCDNLPENGHVLKKVVLQFAQRLDADLYQWIKDNITFPCTMVDRIVPRTTEEDVARVQAKLGMTDEACVVTEPFLQWVIEDKFINARPAWEKCSIANIQLVDNVVPFEEMKLRLLNGTHSVMAYLGYLSGYQTVAQTIHDPHFKTFVRYLMDDEIGPSIHIEGIDLDKYKAQLIERYENTALQHRTWQIAWDGTQKIPQRWLQTIDYGLANGIVIKGLFLALAGWIKFVSAVDEQGNAIDVQDPLKAELAALWHSHADDKVALIDGFLSIDEVFSPTLAANATFKQELLAALELLLAKGAKQCVYDFVAAI